MFFFLNAISNYNNKKLETIGVVLLLNCVGCFIDGKLQKMLRSSKLAIEKGYFGTFILIDNLEKISQLYDIKCCNVRRFTVYLIDHLSKVAICKDKHN